ncbi:MAG: leucine-rich repeat domain-containing protein, partial [Clostridia bacterium]|nr:leucine-rich repeat domain-containing protein [Clostridia bacterium]
FADCSKLRAVVNYSALDISNGNACGGVGRLAVFVAKTAAEADLLFYTQTDGVSVLHFYDNWVAVWCDESVTELDFSTLSGYSTLKIASYAFLENPRIKSADLSGVSAIGENAFYSCSALKNVILGGSLKEIGENAFGYCISLTDINLQDTKLDTLGACAFFACMKLTYVSLPRTLGEICEQTFYYCSALADVVIPRSVTNIGTDAFYGCASLLQVHNLSRISMTAGRADNGYCAYYALYVFTDEQSKMTFAEEGGFKFANYNQSWYLYGYVSYINKVLPESFTYENSTVTGYKIREGALTSATVSYLVIPESVNGIENNAISSYPVIYYCGTSSRWSALRPADLANADVYFYSPCIHTYYGNLWTYWDGIPFTGQTVLDWVVSRPATCETAGVQTGSCPVCGYSETQTVEKLYHSYS